MYWFALLLSLTCLLIIALAIVGRLVVSTFQIDVLRGNESEHWLAALLVGTGAVTLLSGWCSYCGLGATIHRWIVLGGVVLLLGATALRGEAPQLLKVSAPRWWLLAIGGIFVLRAGFYLAPVLSNGSHLLYCDALLYIPAADFLSQHGFGLAAPPVNRPVDQLIAAYHHLSHRMGPIFLHGLVTACVPELGAFELFAVMVALGTVQTLAAAFLVARWCFQADRACSVLGLLFVAVLVHSLGVSATGGCLCQLFGTAILGLSIAVMSKLTTPLSWTRGNAALAGSLVAFQMSMYSELTPVLIFVSILWIAVAAYSAVAASALRQFGWFAFACVLAAAITANIEIVRCWRGVQVMMAINVAGMHIDWTPPQYAEFVLGCNTHDYIFDRPLEGWRYALSAATTSLSFVVGICAWRVRQAVFAVGALAVFTGLFVFYGWFRHDPWTGQVGHSWNLFKICQWAFPFIAATQISGLAHLLHSLNSRRLLQGMLIAIFAIAALQQAHVNRRVSRSLALKSFVRAGHESPYAAVGKLRLRLAVLEGPVHLVRVPQLHGDDPLAASLIYPHRMVNTWENAMHYGAAPLLEERADAYGPSTNYLFFGSLPYQTPLETLPFGFARLDPERPTLVRIDFANRVFVPGYDKVVPLDDSSIVCWIFTTREDEVDISLDLQPPPGNVGGKMTITTPHAGTYVACACNGVARITAVKLQRGLNRVELRWSGEPCEVLRIGTEWTRLK